MANPSSSHPDRDERHRRDSRSSHHHHRTISSTTLLLVLSLILAVLAVMLSLPASNGSLNPPSEQSGLWGYLTPKRSQTIVAREHAVAVREAEVARREAELLIGAPGGVVPSPPTCSPCPTPEVQTVIKEIVKEAELTPPGWWKEADIRSAEILDRELRIAEREREISKREESVNRREHDASRRETWIMEQLIALGNDAPQTVEEEYIYEPAGSKRKAKELPPVIIERLEPETHTVTEVVTVPAPASTRPAAFPAPEPIKTSYSTGSPRTTAVDIIVEEELGPSSGGRARPTARRPPTRWFGNW